MRLKAGRKVYEFSYFTVSTANLSTDHLMKPSFYGPEPHPVTSKFDGRCRVIIERVTPEIDGGRYPAKRVEGELIKVEADIYADGADILSAVLKYRRSGARKWLISPMKPSGNDRWFASFRAGEPGMMEYTIEAWVDHFATWKRGLRKKVDAGQDVSVDLEIGALIVRDAASRAEGRDAMRLQELGSVIVAAGAEPSAVEAAESSELNELMERYVDKAHATQYDLLLPLQVDPAIAGFSTWYELFPRSWSGEPGQHGTFAECSRILPRVGKMGFNVIYLPPIHPIGLTKRKGRNNALKAAPGDPGSCWAIGSPEGGHTSVHPELGSLDDFREFVREAEKSGIQVALDIAFQCSPDHPWVREHPKWFVWRPDGTVQFAENPPKRYEDILPINFESEEWEELWTALRDVFLFWIAEGVKVFRVDNPHTKSFRFWDWALAEIRAQHPDTVFLAEAFTRPKVMARLAKGGYSQSYTYFTWRNTKHDLQEYLTQLTTTELREFMRPNFWPNTPDILHEELQKNGRQMFLIRLVLAATLSSNYGMYGPAYELCEHVPVQEGKEEYLDSEKYEIKAWDMDRPGNIRAEITAINRIRREHPALQQTADITFLRVDAAGGHEHDKLMAYVKKNEDGSSIVLTVVNIDPHAAHDGWLRFPLEQFGLSHDHRFRVEDQLSGAVYDWNGEWNYVSLNPAGMPAHIFSVHLHP